MATIDIGKIKPVFKGTYDNSTAYVLDDIVYYNGSSYVAKTSTTGNLPTDATKWNVLASGSGGIWDSTLSIGSAGQVVKVNSGATALEFGTISSDYVKIATQNVSSAVASVNFDNSVVDFSTYKSLVVVFSGVSFASDGGDLGMRLSSDTGIAFRTTTDVNFKFSSSYDPMSKTVYESSGNIPVTYLLKKTVKIESGEVATERFSFGDAEKYARIALANPKESVPP